MYAFAFYILPYRMSGVVVPILSHSIPFHFSPFNLFGFFPYFSCTRGTAGGGVETSSSDRYSPSREPRYPGQEWQLCLGGWRHSSSAAPQPGSPLRPPDCRYWRGWLRCAVSSKACNRPPSCQVCTLSCCLVAFVVSQICCVTELLHRQCTASLL